MADAFNLPEVLLQQSPGCHWTITSEFVFDRIYGDPSSLFARTAAQLTGQPVAEALHRSVAKTWLARFERSMAGETLMLRERRSNANWYVTIYPLRIEGEVRFAAGLAREVSPWSNAEQQLRHTVLGALKQQEFERAMMSKFLHDSVGQNLTALGLQLDLVRMDLETISPDACNRLAEVQRLLEPMMEEVRDYSYELNPSTVERAGLRSALDRLVARLRNRFTGTVRLNVDPSLKIDPKIASAMYQIGQEAVENAVQHSSCSAIEIAVKSTRSGPSLEIRDNGKGFDPGDLLGGCRGLGLLSMEHYAAQAGLDISILSDRETGTTVKAASAQSV